ncbi:hypothetical protein [Clostridium perfringens]|uniref:hypothetical protein n=1 Tax=Clostridium perfringens TaxID=1502 RepID=UPI0018E4C2CA|nr:hypothetical protein [Clostridium perfringens]MBI6052336.1 hypothetical protein [Clostridium perfringens]
MKVILEDIDFLWSEEDIEVVKKLWERGTGIKDICKVIKREGDEVFLLLLHLVRSGEIKKRKSYIWGKF